LVALAAALVIAATVLPSALNLPQSNPTQTLEFAPVPPTDEDPPPFQGNFSSLGLASGPGLETGGAFGQGAGLPPPPPPVIQQRGGTTKNCVGNPPRQTEDPLSPPCVPEFNCKDNFGATYPGVTESEIKILIYTPGFTAYTGTSRGREETPDNTYWDLGTPAKDDEHMVVRILRGFQDYFNARYQTYCRYVHFFVYFSGQDTSPERRRAEAAENFAEVKPFAVLVFDYENADAYLQTMARRGVLNFASIARRSQEFFSSYQRLIWGYLPAAEYQARQFGSYVCQKVVNKPATFAGPAFQGQPRKLGLYHTTDPGRPDLRLFKDLVVKEIQACGGKFESTQVFPSACCVQDNRYSPDYAATAMAGFQSRGITTVIWPGGVESNGTKAAGAIGYQPEWIIAGDGETDGSNFGQFQDPVVFNNHAWTVSNAAYIPPIQESICFQAHREADPASPENDLRFMCELYPDMRQFFIGVQVAGPRLGPTNLDKGFRAQLPKVSSTDPQVPACFYDPGDYTCVKDAIAMWWNGSGKSANDDTAGCWMLTEAGKRYVGTSWPAGDVTAQRGGADTCNNYNASYLINPNPPGVDL
jgi:hypothetical protein